MSVETLALVLHHSRATGTDKLVLVGIANHAGDGGSWPKVDTLAGYCNRDRRTVQRSLNRLVELGELRIHAQDGGTGDRPWWQRSNRYDVLVACPAGCDRTAQHRVRELPSSAAALWTDGVTPTSPHDAHVARGVTPTPPGGVTPTSPEPSSQPSPHHRPASVTGRRGRETATGSTPPCVECGAPDLDRCASRQARLRLEDRHHYHPRSPR